MFSLKNLTHWGILLLVLGFSRPAQSWTMVNLSMEETALNTLKDGDQNGLPDGGVVVASLLYSQKERLRIDYVMQVVEWLSQDSDLQRKYPKDSFFTFSGTPLNPFSSLITTTPENEYVIFLRENPRGHLIPQSMKVAPIKIKKLSDGTKIKEMRNPWAIERRIGEAHAQSQRIAPVLQKSTLSSFTKDYQDFEAKILSIYSHQ